ncbi:RelA/SpoT domain-containing protein [soil metagenome]
MQYASPEYSRREVNRAGLALINPKTSPQELILALIVINNWRSSHNFPLRTIQSRLREKAKQIDSNSIVVRRIKRLSSIKSKLKRIKGLNLVQIQDIGGCRAIVKNIDALDELVNVYKASRAGRGIKHTLFSVDDYVLEKPKVDGYRSVHLVYQYKSDKNKVYDNLKIEVQIRTVLQHAWATAVETIDTFTGQSLKSGDGKKRWTRFFAVISSVIALKEKRPAIPNTSSDFTTLRNEIIHLEKQLGVVAKLEAFTTTLQYAEETNFGNESYYLLALDPATKKMRIRTFSSKDSNLASKAYLQLESQNIQGKQNVVLVSADSLDSLKLAYPNYYADTRLFINILKEILSGKSQLSLFEDIDFV